MNGKNNIFFIRIMQYLRYPEIGDCMEVYDFGLRLRDLRKARGFSQTDVARRLDITRGAISSYENNITVPPVDKLAQMALLYRVSTDYLLNLDKRRTISLGNDLTESQKDTLVRINEELIQEFQMKNFKR